MPLRHETHLQCVGALLTYMALTHDARQRTYGANRGPTGAALYVAFFYVPAVCGHA